MKKYVLDISVVVGYLLAREKAIQLVRPMIAKDQAATSILVYGEVVEYVKKFADFTRHKARLEALLGQVSPFPLTYAILERYADIRRMLRLLHKDIGDIDTLIAATALEEHVTLVTIDRDFERIPSLKMKLVSLKAA